MVKRRVGPDIGTPPGQGPDGTPGQGPYGVPGQRVVLITGASTGIGQACAEHLHRRGYRVYGTSRRAASVTAVSSPLSFPMIKMDVDFDKSVAGALEWLMEREGRLDVLVNNAGYGMAGAVEDTSIEEAKAQFETNFFGALRLCRAVVPIMRTQAGGYIVNVSSLAGRVGMPFQALYSASKFALEGFTEALRLEVHPFGIRVLLIEPGDFRTAFTENRVRTEQSLASPVYQERCGRAVSIMAADERKGSDPIRVAHLLERIIENPTPRLRYTVGQPYQRAAVWLRRIVPARLFEWALTKYYRLD